LAFRKLLVLFIIVAAAAGFAVVFLSDSGERPSTVAPRKDTVPLAILGDSDSHSFHDRTHFPPRGDERGGQFRDITFNWPEMLARLRGDQLDLGEWRVWGPPNLIAKAREIIGLPVRRPQKEDYRYNFAISGAGCKDLNHGWREVDRLLAVMRLEPERWQRGIVVIRIGVNDIGGTAQLDEFAKDPASGADKVRYCTSEIASAVNRLREASPRIRFVLVGIFNNAHWAPNLEKWQSPTELSNIAQALARFDNELRELTASDAATAFFDDRRWFEEHWGARDETGKPAYHAVVLPSGLRVENSKGDAPSNAALGDGHAGTVWNGLWAKSFVELLNEKLDTQIPPIEVSEVERVISRPSASG